MRHWNPPALLVAIKVPPGANRVRLAERQDTDPRLSWTRVATNRGLRIFLASSHTDRVLAWPLACPSFGLWGRVGEGAVQPYYDLPWDETAARQLRLTSHVLSAICPTAPQWCALYHGTTWRSAVSISRSHMRPSAAGMLGPVCYYGDMRKATRFAWYDTCTYEPRRDPTVLRCFVHATKLDVRGGDLYNFRRLPACACARCVPEAGERRHTQPLHGGAADHEGESAIKRHMVDHEATWARQFDVVALVPGSSTEWEAGKQLVRTLEVAVRPDCEMHVADAAVLRTEERPARYTATAFVPARYTVHTMNA